MIIVIVENEYDEKRDMHHLVVSHGIDLENDDAVVVLPQIHPMFLDGVEFDKELGEYVLE